MMRIFSKALKITLALSALMELACRESSQPGGGYSGESSRPQPPSLISFENGRNALGIPFRIVNNSMLITATVNDSLEVELVFDSGLPLNGVLLFDSTLGRRLGLRYVSRVRLGGAGTDTVMANVAVGGIISVPGVTFQDQNVLVVSNCNLYEDWPADGVIGGTMLNSCVVEIDHDNHILNLYDRALFDSHRAGEVMNLTFSQGIPVVKVLLRREGRQPESVNLLFDTGADVPFSLHDSNGSNRALPPNSFECFLSEGINGEVFGYWARMEGLQLGSFLLENVLVAYPTKGWESVVADLGQDGFFGLTAQRQFKTTFDYQACKLYLKADSRLGQPFEFNMAGLVLHTLKNGLQEVRDVIPKSPADSAGIKKEDCVVGIDHRSVLDLSWEELEKLFTEEGRRLPLAIQRGNQKVDVTVILRRII